MTRIKAARRRVSFITFERLTPDKSANRPFEVKLYMTVRAYDFSYTANMRVGSIANFGVDWAWSLPLIVVTVLIHVLGLSLIRRAVDRLIPHIQTQHIFSAPRRWCIGGAALCITVLHSAEAALWATMFLFLGALPNVRTAILYSLNAITAFGHVNFYLSDRWQLMGALEALNGWILFGLSTAFLFGLIQRVWPHVTDAALSYAMRDQQSKAA